MSPGSTPHRSEGRYHITSNAIRVTVTYTDEAGERHECRGELFDLSPRGVRASLDGCLQRGQKAQLKLEVTAQSVSIDIDAYIRWQHPRDAVTWWTGCELEQPFEADFIEKLAAAKVLNRRRDARYETDKQVQVRSELSSSIHEARLVNYSKGGFCLVFKEQVEFPHHRLMLTISGDDQPRTIPARVKWARPVGDAYGIGCSFSDLDGFVHLRDFVEPLARRRVLQIVRPTNVSSLIAFAMALTIALQTSWLMRSQPELAAAIRNGWADWVVEPIRQLTQEEAKPSKVDPDQAV
jgi:Tfp pilus assembly protein PilZ